MGVMMGRGGKKMHSRETETVLAKPNLNFSICGHGCIDYTLAEIFPCLKLDMSGGLCKSPLIRP